MPPAWLSYASPLSNTPFLFASTQTSYCPGVNGADQTRVFGRFPEAVVVAVVLATALDGKAVCPSGIR